MLMKINYPLLIKFWIICFLKKKSIVSLSIQLKNFTAYYLVCLYMYPLNQSNTYKKLLCKCKKRLSWSYLQLELQKELQSFFGMRLKIYFGSVCNFLSRVQKERNNFLYKYMRQFKYLQNKLSFDTQDLILTAVLAVVFRNPAILTFYLSKLFTRTKKHSLLIKIFKRIFCEFTKHYTEVLGLKIVLSGKINGVSRTKLRVLKFGTLTALSSRNGKIYYAYTSSSTFTGVFGIKVWVIY